MANLIKVKVFPVGKKPYWKVMEDTLDEFQSLVGGWIESVTLPDENGKAKVILLVNEEGKLIGLPRNLILADRMSITKFDLQHDLFYRSDCLCGTVVACRIDGDDFASLEPEDIPTLCRWLGERARLE